GRVQAFAAHAQGLRPEARGGVEVVDAAVDDDGAQAALVHARLHEVRKRQLSQEREQAGEWPPISAECRSGALQTIPASLTPAGPEPRACPRENPPRRPA